MVPCTSLTIYKSIREARALQRGITYHFERLSEPLLLRRCLVLIEVACGCTCKTLVWVCTADGAIGLVENLLRLFKEWTDVLDESVFVAVVLTLGSEGFEFLSQSLAYGIKA